ncbi:hypothetical protein Tco_0480226 [Tanacetum coccineum]
MSAIIDIRCVLTQKTLDAFCDKFHIPEEVHPVLPNQNDTMHGRPTGKIGLYTRFFDYANFRLPLSTFLVDVLRHLPSFPWHTAKHVIRDPDPVAADFNAHDYATLVVHPSPFQKFLEAFLCLVGLSCHDTLDEETYPLFLHKNREGGCLVLYTRNRYLCMDLTKVRVVKRERNEDEPRLLDTTVGRTVPLLPVAPDRADSELEASVERLFDEGGSGNQTEQGDSPGLQGKRKSVVVDAGGASHPTKKLREDHKTSSGASVGGKSRSAIKRLLARAVLNAEFGVAAIPTLPFVTTFVSSTPEHEAEDHTDSVAELNLRTIGASQRSSVPIMTTVTIVTSMVDPALVVKESPVKPSLFFVDSSSAGGADPNTSVFSDLTGNEFLVGGIRTVIDPDNDLHKVYVPQWSVTNRSRLDDGRLFTEFNVGAARQMCLNAEVRKEEIRNLKAQLLLREAEVAKAIRLHAKAFNFETVEKSLRDEANILKERNAILEKERSALDVKVTNLEASAVSKDSELTDLNALVTSVKSQNDILVDRLEVSSSGLQEKVTVYDNCMEQLEKFQDDRMKVVNDKFDKLYTNFVEMALHLEEKFFPHLLTTIYSRRWLLTQGMELAITKCLNSAEYLSVLGAAIGKAIKKGMQDGLSARITHGKEGRFLTDVAAYNPSAEVDYTSALQQLQNVNFPLLTKLKSNKDASIEAVMNILHLEKPLVDKLGLSELQPHIDQLMVPIHHSPDKVVIVATALSLALDVSSTDGTSDTVPATADTTTTLSITFDSASTITPIYVDDYEVVGTDDQADVDRNAEPFPNVDEAVLNCP